MSLIPISEFNGSLTGEMVLDTLQMIGVLNMIGNYGYTLHIDGKQEVTPKGFIDDTPNNHTIIIEKNGYITRMSKKAFRDLVKNKEKYDKLIKDQFAETIDFEEYKELEFNCLKKQITRDEDTGYTWFNHKIEFDINKTVLETMEAYAQRMVKTIADLIIGTFEEMLTVGSKG